MEHLQRFAIETHHVKQLRETIINLAVGGRLVCQDPNEEPASMLVTRLRADTINYAREQGIAVPPQDLSGPGETHIRVPQGWSRVRLASLCRIITDGDHQPPPRADQGVPFLTIGNVTTGRLDFANCRFVTNDYYNSIAEYRRPVEGDILYTVVGATFGRPCFIDTSRDFCVQRHIAMLKPCSELNVSYLCFLLASRLVYEQARRSTTGTAQPTIGLRLLRNFAVLLPPLAEQNRIVSKVDELMAVCDRLETSLARANIERERFLQAVLYQALATTADEDAAILKKGVSVWREGSTDLRR